MAISYRHYHQPKASTPVVGETALGWDEEASHELYNLGHMVDAACAHYQATGSTKFPEHRQTLCRLRGKEVGPKTRTGYHRSGTSDCRDGFGSSHRLVRRSIWMRNICSTIVARLISTTHILQS